MAIPNIEKLSTWFTKFKRYKVSYKNGSFHLASLFNSPYTVVEGFDKMPFCKHYREEKRLTSDSVFIESSFNYANPDEGLWLIISELNFKRNILMTNLYDKSLPIDYHFINLHIKKSPLVNKSLVNGFVMKDKTWSMFKAGCAETEYHFKNSIEQNITIFFTSEWLEKLMASSELFRKSSLGDFFNSSNNYMIVDEDDPVYDQFYEEILELCKENARQQCHSEIVDYTTKILSSFVHVLGHQTLNENHFNISDKDRKNIQRTEQYLKESLLGSFPGIDALAKKIGVSPTKLKSDFKSIHNKTLYQYFSQQQMKFAHELLSKKQHTVKEVAKLVGYENSSKFSAAFKKNFDIQPSTLLD